MMATEATQENFADASNPADTQDVLTEPRQDVLSVSPLINGEASASDGDKLDTGLGDKASQYTSAAASVSGGSDTEASKGENSKLRVDDKGHTRATSIVKKTTSFKAVTVNKTFLAAKGTTGPVTSKLGENKPVAGSTAVQTGPSASTAPRPRLVAKTGSGLRDSAPRSSASTNGGKPGSAPDPSAVWNKNRPVPPPEPKRLTDDDLRKQFGIHLATRIQGDDSEEKKANWADIDDDEDDWAPDTIEWTDGTKITVQPADEPTPVPAEQMQSKAPIASEISKPQSPAPSTTTTSTSTVRLGGISGGPGKGLILKGAGEKPTLVAKPPGPPTQVKSPWLPLPPVDKVAPIAIDPQSSQLQQQAPPRFQPRDPHGFENMPPKPTKEIAADDFSRGGWRDTAQNRELFNSQSGRYEPVADNRRNSRNDIHSRQPALLQRPTHHDQQGPAEPSGAFQTHRTSGESSYGRRRNSSNVSGGSGNNARRVSFSRGGEMPTSHEFAGPRRGSLAAVSDAPSSPRNFSPAAQHPGQRGNNPPWQSRASPATSHNSPSLVHNQMAIPTQSGKQPPPLEEVELQKKIMTDSREAARKRRAELEAKEEAERKERIRLKLESMGPAPESNKQKKDALAEVKAAPTQIQIRDSADGPPKPLATEMTEAKEFSVSKAESTSTVELQSPFDPDRNDQKSSPQDPISTRPAATDIALPPSQIGPSSQSWQSAAQTSKYPGWSANAQQSTTRSVWSSHGIGNGSFGLQETAGAQAGPGPIGPPNAYRSNNSQNGRGREQYGNRPSPIAPPNGQSAAPQRTSLRQPASALPVNNPWANFNIAESDKQMAATREQENAARLEREAIEGVKEPERVDTWKRVDLQANGERTRVKMTSTIVKPATINGVPVDENASSRLLPAGPLAPNGVHQDAISGPITTNTSASSITTSPAQRGSRFFPSRSNRDVRLEEGISFGRSSSPSPPPPTMAGHPAYDGDSIRPHVSLPRPPPVVKLPPATLAPIGPPKPAPSFAAAAASSANQSFLPNNQSTRQDSRQHVPPANGDWQNKINNLIGRKASPPKSYALAVDSSSKYAFELSELKTLATVTLPGSRSVAPWDDETSFTTKPMSEECFEEQEMGSIPVVNLPRASTAPWVSTPRLKPISQKPKAPEVTSAKALPFYPENGPGGPTIAINVPGTDTKTSVPASFLNNNRQRSNHGRGGQRGGGSSRGNSSYNRGGRRESSNYPPSKTENVPSSSPNNHSTRGSGGRGRGFGSSNWNASRHVSTPVTSN